jgi:hypothetical protein
MLARGGPRPIAVYFLQLEFGAKLIPCDRRDVNSLSDPGNLQARARMYPTTFYY